MKMKKSLHILLVFFTLVTFISNAQSNKTHYDDKPYIEGEMLLQITENQNIREIVSRAPSNYELVIDRELSKPMRVWLLNFDHTTVSHEQMQYWLYSQKEVSVADYNYNIEMRATLPGDPSITSQWHHDNTGQTGGTADADIDSDLAWDITTGGSTAYNDDIVVCMLEGSGGNLDHQDLSPNRWSNAGEIDGNGIDDDGNGYVDDKFGWNPGSNNDNTGTGSHGTNCLGMIGAKGDNGLNVVGANWDVKLMVLNMSGGLSQASVIEAYTYPLVQRQLWNTSGGTQGAFVVATSASWGIDGANPSSYPLWCQFYDTLGYYGILNVGATTNSNLDVDTAGDMPTACNSDYMIGVGRTDHNDNTAGGYGDQTIEFGAPGINVVTTNGSIGITTTTGTSFSCPLTAGVIGLAYSIPCTDFMDIVLADPKGGADLVLQAMLDGVDAKTQLASKFITGGRLNAKNTLDNLMDVGCNLDTCYMTTISTVIDPTCVGMDNGSISLAVSGGVPGYTYDWGVDGGDVDNISALSEGSYEVIISDGSACDTVISYTIAYTTTISGSINSTDITCNGLTDGSATVVGAGGTSYTYQWAGGPATDVYNGMGAGNFTVDITDAGGCVTQESVTIVEPFLEQGNFNFGSSFLSVTFSPTTTTGTYLWDFGDSNSSTDSNPVHVYATGGTYTVCLDITTNCGTFQKCKDITVIGNPASIIENAADFVSVYPNPANNIVNFKITSAEMIKIEIADVVGKLVSSKRITSEVTSIDVEQFSNGTYFYKILGDDGNILLTNKIVVSE